SDYTYQFTLSYLDGRVEYLNENGNIACMADRYGNTVRFDYLAQNPTTVTLPSGSVIAITGTASELTFTNPLNEDTVVSYASSQTANLIQSITYPTGL